MKEKYVIEDLQFSSLFGRGIYRVEEELVPDPLSKREGGLSPLLVNVLTGERFYVKRIPAACGNSQRFSDEVFRPAPRSVICWPSDMVHLTESIDADTKLSIANQYSADPDTTEGDKAEYGLLFRYDDVPETIGWDEKIDTLVSKKRSDNGTERGQNWRNPGIRELAASIVSTLAILNRAGYAFCDFHRSRLFFPTDEPGRVMFDFSNLAFWSASSRGYVAVRPHEREYPVEFAEPGYVRGTHGSFDLQTQNFSLCAMLFYLFYGRYAYDGALQYGHIDDSLQSHYIRFRDYYNVPPIFIFDPDDRTNALGTFDEEQIIIDLWEESPSRLKELFVKTLKTDNALRRRKDGAVSDNPGPDEWLQCFEEIGWISSKTQDRGAI